MSSIIELLTRVLCDVSPQPYADLAFLFGQTEDNQESVLLKAEELLHSNSVQRIGFLNTSALSGYPGFHRWQTWLLERGIPKEKIIGIPILNPTMIHTRIEAEAMVNYVKANQYQSVYILAAPFHQLRAFMTAVTMAIELDSSVKLYSQPGASLSWQEHVFHSQGQTKGTRSELIAGELKRIDTYIQKGDLGSVKQVLDYLNKRDL